MIHKLQLDERTHMEIVVREIVRENHYKDIFITVWLSYENQGIWVDEKYTDIEIGNMMVNDIDINDRLQVLKVAKQIIEENLINKLR